MGCKEDPIQIAIVEYLEIKHHYFFSIPNEAIGSGKNNIQAAIRGRHLNQMGRKKGVADLWVLWSFGVASFIEVKAPKGVQSKAQKEFQCKIEKQGIHYDLARSVDDVIKIEARLKKERQQI